MLLIPEIQRDALSNGAQQQRLQSQGRAVKTGRMAGVGTRQAAPGWLLPAEDCFYLRKTTMWGWQTSPQVRYELLGVVPGPAGPVKQSGARHSSADPPHPADAARIRRGSLCHQHQI